MKQGWEIKKISEIGNIYNGNSINEEVKKNKYAGIKDGLPYIATKDVSYESIIDYDNGIKIPFKETGLFKIAPRNTVLICAEGGSAGRKIGYTNQDVCFGNKLFAISTNNNIEGRFVYYYYFSSTFQKHFSAELAGIIGGVSINKFKDIEIPIPPLSEQKRIVAILDEAFVALAKAKENAEKNLQNARSLFESHLQSIFTQSGKGWVKKPLAELCDPDRVITYGVIKLGDEVPDGVPCLRTSNVRWLRIETEGMKRIAPVLSSEYSRTILKGGEVLVSVRGTLGGVAVVTRKMAGWNVSREVAVVPVDPLRVNPAFLSFLIGSGTSQQWLGGVKKGATYVGINIEDLRLLPVSVPDINKQLEVVRHLELFQENIQRLALIFQQKLTALEALKESLLYQALNGEL